MLLPYRHIFTVLGSECCNCATRREKVLIQWIVSHCYYALFLITELYVCITDLFSLSLLCSLGVVCVRIKISLLLFHCMILSILFRFRFLAVNIARLSHDVSAMRVYTIKSLSSILPFAKLEQCCLQQHWQAPKAGQGSNQSQKSCWYDLHERTSQAN
jgi:hypothetical protein